MRIPINEDLEKILKELPATGPLFVDLQESGLRHITRTFWKVCHYVGLPPILSLHSYRLRKLLTWGASMKEKFRLYHRGNGTYYAEERETGARESLGTKDQSEAGQQVFQYVSSSIN
ncbi:MAG: hypothetical protein WCD79_03040 [Chthoniobacteraceae bacterium]